MERRPVYFIRLMSPGDLRKSLYVPKLNLWNMQEVKMGVDIGIWLCRVGMFIPGHGAGVVIINFSRLMKIIGCVSFVRILQIVSGIEQNPGPDTFTFRYQYLLVDIGTKVLREFLFVTMTRIGVGQFFNSKSNNTRKLARAKVITPAQELMLLPANNQPCVGDFDITLLSCLLRNVCGLYVHRS